MILSSSPSLSSSSPSPPPPLTLILLLLLLLLLRHGLDMMLLPIAQLWSCQWASWIYFPCYCILQTFFDNAIIWLLRISIAFPSRVILHYFTEKSLMFLQPSSAENHQIYYFFFYCDALSAFQISSFFLSLLNLNLVLY